MASRHSRGTADFLARLPTSLFTQLTARFTEDRDHQLRSLSCTAWVSKMLVSARALALCQSPAAGSAGARPAKARRGVAFRPRAALGVSRRLGKEGAAAEPREGVEPRESRRELWLRAESDPVPRGEVPWLRAESDPAPLGEVPWLRAESDPAPLGEVPWLRAESDPVPRGELPLELARGELPLELARDDDPFPLGDLELARDDDPFPLGDLGEWPLELARDDDPFPLGDFPRAGDLLEAGDFDFIFILFPRTLAGILWVFQGGCLDLVSGIQLD